MRLSAVMISSPMPSAKYSCSGSPDMLANGSTAIDGLSGNASAGSATGFRPITTRKTRTGREMFFRLCLTDVLESQVEAARRILPHSRRDADAAGLGQTFEPCRDVHPVAK